MQTDSTYLGDGVYANFDGFHIVIGTRGTDSNMVFLDRAVWQALVNYGDRVFGSAAEDTIYGNCSRCGEPIDDNDPEVHTDWDGYDCHARCCPVCHEGEPPYEYTEETEATNERA